jgi:alpha-aminoadipic semialdehyde synthase
MPPPLHGNGVVGVLRETKNKWERRSPLAPADVAQLVRAGLRVIVQPSSRRVFADAAFAQAGAELAEDLSPCGTVLAVKEVPLPALLADRTFLFFSHTHKAQPANMPLLDALLARRVRLLDYELATEDGSRGGARLIAFGRFAGIAGAVDILRGLGERLLARGFNTPFLSVGAMYTYVSVEAAFAAVRACGAAIAEHGLPAAVGPLTVVVTGGGKVAGGALEVYSLLPCVRLASPFELRSIVASAEGRARTHVVYLAQATVEHTVRRRPAAAVGAAEGAASADADAGADAPLPDDVDVDVAAFDKAEFKARPDLYEAIFHIKVAPFTSLLCVANYWEERFPRLLTTAQTRALDAARRLRLVALCDISCDMKGSVEWLSRFTSIERPFLIYEPAVDVLHESIDYETAAAPLVGGGGNAAADNAFEPRGILFHAVDHLPSECPRDASEHFSRVLAPFVSTIARCAGGDALPVEQQLASLPPPLAGAMLCCNGALTPNFAYIAQLREAAAKAQAGRGLRRARNESFLAVRLAGHLFDKRVVNDALDAVELRGASAHIIDVSLGRDLSAPTELRLQVLASSAAAAAAGAASGAVGRADPGAIIAAVLDDLRRITAAAGATLAVEGSDSNAASAFRGPVQLDAAAVASVLPVSPPAAAQRCVLVLGAGFVAGPCVAFLLRRPEVRVTLVSVVPGEAEAMAAGCGARIAPLLLDVGAEAAKEGGGRLGAMVAAHDLIVSLVPAPLHARVAQLAIAAGRSMVTASYVAPEMAALDAAARAAGVTILNECGLDPGIDHMAVRRLVDGVHARGGRVTHFLSACGGLPAPEAASNPLGYKFSWSPRGALAAMTNGARFRRDGAEETVAPGGALLAAAAPFALAGFPGFALEALPNRDSLAYLDKYDLLAEDAAGVLRSVRRSTLRYAGFSQRLELLTAAGLLRAEAAPLPRGLAAGAGVAPPTLREVLAASLGEELGASASVLAAAALARVAALAAPGRALPPLGAREAAEFLAWLGLDARVTLVAAPAAAGASWLPLDSLAPFLAAHAGMALRTGERDAAIMQHELRAEMPGGAVEHHSSSLLEFAHESGSGGGALVTAMARTVGLTAGAAAALLLDGGGAGRGGVFTPTTPEFYEPILNTLEREGVRLFETVRLEEAGMR